MSITPDAQDYQTVETQYGQLPENASDAERAHHYRLAVAAKLIRLYDQGKLPLDQMRALDELRDQKK